MTTLLSSSTPRALIAISRQATCADRCFFESHAIRVRQAAIDSSESGPTLLLDRLAQTMDIACHLGLLGGGKLLYLLDDGF